MVLEAKIADTRLIGDFEVVYVDDTATTLLPNQQICIVDSGDGTVTITLPNVGDAKGKTYFIQATTGNTNAVTVTDGGDDALWSDITDLDAANDYLGVLSLGYRWVIVADSR